MSLWFAGTCLLIVVVAIIIVLKVGQSIENKPRHILAVLLCILAGVLIVYMILALILLSAV